MDTRMVGQFENAFSALRHRNFRLFWFGQCVSLIGTWMQTIGQSWLVMELTNSKEALGLVAAVQFFPMMLFALFSGAIADKLPKRKVIIACQSCLMMLALVLASLTYFKVIQYWHILVLAGLLGLVNSLDMPTRQAFFAELVGKADLMNAIALNSTIFNIARIIGPAVAGFLIGLIGIASCFYLNALSFVAVLIGLWLIKLPVEAQVAGGAGANSVRAVLHNTREGLHYIFARPVIYLPLLLLAMVSIFVINFNVFVPLVAKDILHQEARGFGILMSAMGCGSLLGALTLAAKSRSGPKLRVLLLGALGMCLLVIALGCLRIFWLSAVTLFGVGFSMINFTASTNTVIQLNSDDHMRGRVMGVYALVFGGVTPIGSLLAGVLAERIGSGNALVICGSAGVLAICGVYLAYGRINRVERGQTQTG